MSKQTLNLGTTPNDGTGDSLYNGGSKINSNFNELYSALGDGSDLSVGAGKTVISVDTSVGRVGIATASPTSTLTVSGDVLISGIATASSFVADSFVGIATTALTSNYSTLSGISTNTIGGISSVTRLSVSGLSTFLGGPVLIGSASSTGTALQRFQLTGGAYISGSTGIGTTNPTSSIHVIGDGRFTGVVTATSFTGSLNGNASTATTATSTNNVIGGIASVSSLSVTGLSTFASGPVLIGSGSSTGTLNQTLQVTGGAYISTSVGIGTTRPTAFLHLPSGTTSANSAPIKLSPGSLLSTPESGTFEYDANTMYFTPSSTTGRGIVPSILITSGTNTFGNVSTAQTIFPLANDTLTVVSATTYMVEASIYIDQVGTNSRSLGFSMKGNGSATFTSTALQVVSVKNNNTPISVAQPTLTFVTAETNTVVTESNSSRYILLKISGLIRINAGGTIVPQITFSGIPGNTPTGSTNNYLYLYPIGSNSVTSVGIWT